MSSKEQFLTIDGFEQLTPQQVFDMSVTHVLKNGKPSRDSAGGVG